MSILNVLNSKDSKTFKSPEYPIYDIKINSLQGKPIHFSDFKGKHILFVNVASKCGFTPQYKELQNLDNTYKNELVVIGVPCNQF
jgi:glutathione peroxidase